MAEAVDLANCDREPIHIPGAIQAHGCLLACDARATLVTHHSANAAAMLGIEAPINGRPLGDVLGPQLAHDLRNALSGAADGRPAMLVGVPLGDKRFDVAVHIHAGAAIAEFEPAGGGNDPLHRARELIGRVGDAVSVERLLTITARLARALLGYDRVMIYRFEADGAGKVASEVRRPDLETFLGQYFPASDIPRQARALYLSNTLRVISDIDGARVPVIPELDEAGAPLDLSFAHLRSVSPVHCEFLRNMGVAASMSISIVVEGRLWGLIACHHYAPRVLPMSERIAAELFGQFFSLHLQALLQREGVAAATEARASLDRFLRLASAETDVECVLAGSLPDFARLMPCDGIGIWFGGRWTAEGRTPPADAMPALVDAIGAAAGGRIWATHAISQLHPPGLDWCADAAGVLAVPLSQTPRDWLLFFRREFVHTLDWAGDPEKRYTTGPLGDRLTPRTSFAIWKQTVECQSQPWTDADREIAEAVRAAVVEVVLRHNELMAEERGKADVRQRMLNEELNHRVKNILAVIRSLVGHPMAEGRDLADYIAALQGRVQALAFAHDQVARGDGGGLLADLLRAELGPYGDRAGVVLDGPGVWLDSRAFSVMALMLHELATNAAKYGALSPGNGCLTVAWALTPAGDLSIDWRETGGPPVAPPTRSGFGTALIQRSVPYDLGGEASVEHRPDGVVARFRLPAAHVSPASPAPGIEAPADVAASRRPVAPRTDLDVLLVEDQVLIAMDAETMLTDSCARRVVTVATVAAARAHLRDMVPDVAVLDLNLARDTSIPIAEDLVRRRVPFIFATGYGEGAHIPEAMRAVPIVRKPYDAAALGAAISVALAGAQG